MTSTDFGKTMLRDHDRKEMITSSSKRNIKKIKAHFYKSSRVIQGPLVETNTAIKSSSMISWWYQHRNSSESWILIFDMIRFLGLSGFGIIRFLIHLNFWHDQIFGVLKFCHDQDFLILKICHDRMLGISNFEIVVSPSWHHHGTKFLRSLLKILKAQSRFIDLCVKSWKPKVDF